MFNHMVEEVAEMDAVFHALAHGARRDMLGRLAGAELTVGELAGPLAMSLAAASKHVKVLENAGLVCRLSPAPLASASEWLAHYERYWSESLDALDALLRSDPAPDKEQR
jgi:DNA-binding transcriptional ArsR family regulator